MENRLRSQIWLDLLPPRLVNSNKPQDRNLVEEHAKIAKRYPFIGIDSEQFAAIGLDLKNVNNVSLNVQNDWKYISANVTRNFHLGPTLTENRTFEYAPPLAIAQIADLGPAKNFAQPGNPLPPAASRYTTAYFYQPSADERFYCFESLANSSAKSLYNAADEIQNFVENQGIYQKAAKFERIMVGNVTLARWLQYKAEELTENSRTIYPTPESISIGQIYYTFTLEEKPGIDARFSLTATVISPFLPDVSAGIDHTSTFYVYLNTTEAATTISAKQGNSCNKSIKNAKCATKAK